MAIITAITPQIKDKDRCNIYLDNVFFCGMELSTVINNRLKVGDGISYEELAAVQLESEKSRALDKALDYIAKSVKTEKQITDHLKRKGYCEAVIEYCLEKMRGYGFVNDGAYAKSFAQSKKEKKGKRLIEYELMAKGLAKEDIENALSEIDSQAEAAYGILLKYLKNKEIDRENLQKGYRYLLSKGFSYEDASYAVGKFKEEEWN